MNPIKSLHPLWRGRKIKIKCRFCEWVEMTIAVHGARVEVVVLVWRAVMTGKSVLGRRFSPVSWWACSRTEPASPPSAPASPSAGQNSVCETQHNSWTLSCPDYSSLFSITKANLFIMYSSFNQWLNKSCVAFINSM